MHPKVTDNQLDDISHALADAIEAAAGVNGVDRDIVNDAVVQLLHELGIQQVPDKI